MLKRLMLKYTNIDVHKIGDSLVSDQFLKKLKFILSLYLSLAKILILSKEKLSAVHK